MTEEIKESEVMEKTEAGAEDSEQKKEERAIIFEEALEAIHADKTLKKKERAAKLAEIGSVEDDFMKFAQAQGMVGIKGHRSVGGFRASCYNALPMESVDALIACMKEYELKH